MGPSPVVRIRASRIAGAGSQRLERAAACAQMPIPSPVSCVCGLDESLRQHDRAEDGRRGRREARPEWNRRRAQNVAAG